MTEEPPYVISVLAVLLALREWGVIKFPLPELKLQTEKVFANNCGFVIASAMWGLHIGLGFATRITYGGFWVLVAVIVALGDPVYGAALMSTYWVGRSLSLWIAPLLIRRVGPPASELPEIIMANSYLYHRLVGLVLIWVAVIEVLAARPHYLNLLTGIRQWFFQ